MAGTPTPNYNFPTYAETDAPDLSGAYNQAVNAIDAKIKEVADTIPSDVDVPDATSTTKGIAKLYDSATVGAGDQDDGGITPKAVKDYVDAKVPTEQQAYTGTSPIVVDNGSHAISVNPARDYTWNGNKITSIGEKGVVSRVNLPTTSDARRIDAQEPNYWVTGEPSITVPTIATLKAYVALHTPNASTSAKGLVRLTTFLNPVETDKALTAESFRFADGKYDATSRPLTVAELSQLKVNTVTGLVYLNIPGTD